MRVYIWGSTGMLGSYVFAYLKQKGMDVIGVSHDDIDISDIDMVSLSNWFDTGRGIYTNDTIINCVGLIKQKMTEHDNIKAIKINSIFPYILNDFCNKRYINLLHVSTDCCFSGMKGDYVETDIPDPEDIYGMTKVAGEPRTCSVLRTSVIGEGIFKKSLIEWVRSQKNINGYINHLWNGVTCLQFAKLMEHIIKNALWWRGIRHYFSETVTKAQLVRHIASTYDNDIIVTDVEAPQSINRTLGTIYEDYFGLIKTPNILTQIIEQKNFKL